MLPEIASSLSRHSSRSALTDRLISSSFSFSSSSPSANFVGMFVTPPISPPSTHPDSPVRFRFTLFLPCVSFEASFFVFFSLVMSPEHTCSVKSHTSSPLPAPFSAPALTSPSDVLEEALLLPPPPPVSAPDELCVCALSASSCVSSGVCHTLAFAFDLSLSLSLSLSRSLARAPSLSLVKHLRVRLRLRLGLRLNLRHLNST